MGGSGRALAAPCSIAVFGTYTDVTPRQFFNVQLDTEYRKQWDSLVIKLDVIERDAATGSEVIHWVTHFPYPMYSRDYVYVRRYRVDKENNLMVLVSRWVVLTHTELNGAGWMDPVCSALSCPKSPGVHLGSWGGPWVRALPPLNALAALPPSLKAVGHVVPCAIKAPPRLI
ncbi:stAR-related lipid transfer protein 7, mitochondrial [Coturnix japonica]|uniref:stAR-related lipid transfer protein 7, mitochondrial n=1 Tax=Coturnix japonica TaxID=93934 RepID=UPI0013A5D7B8|nr:stAR-related lipid transfer protein 7, mitochondrial [Coturnix japonica]